MKTVLTILAIIGVIGLTLAVFIVTMRAQALGIRKAAVSERAKHDG